MLKNLLQGESAPCKSASTSLHGSAHLFRLLRQDTLAGPVRLVASRAQVQQHVVRVVWHSDFLVSRSVARGGVCQQKLRARQAKQTRGRAPSFWPAGRLPGRCLHPQSESEETLHAHQKSSRLSSASPSCSRPQTARDQHLDRTLAHASMSRRRRSESLRPCFFCGLCGCFQPPGAATPSVAGPEPWCGPGWEPPSVCPSQTHEGCPRLPAWLPLEAVPTPSSASLPEMPTPVNGTRTRR